MTMPLFAKMIKQFNQNLEKNEWAIKMEKTFGWFRKRRDDNDSSYKDIIALSPQNPVALIR